MRSRLNKYSNLTQRIIVAILGVTVIISAIYWQAWSYYGVFLIITFFSLQEFYKLIGIDGYLPLRFWGILTAYRFWFKWI